MQIMGLNHLTFSVSDLDRSISFYRDALGARLLVKGNTTAYFSLAGLWIALNVEKNISRNEILSSYTHLAWTIADCDFGAWQERLTSRNVNILPGRVRDERDKGSIYFTDPDGHKFELHTGSLQDRLAYYKAEKPHMIFFD